MYGREGNSEGDREASRRLGCHHLPGALGGNPQLAESMGYRPNPLLSSLASKKFRTGKTIRGTPIAIMNFPMSAFGAESAASIPDLYIRERQRGIPELPMHPLIPSAWFDGEALRPQHGA